MTREIYHKGRVVGQHHYWYRAPRSEPQEDSRTTCRYWERARSMEKAPEPLMMMARAMAIAHANCLDAERSMESAPEPLARQMTTARMWYS